LNESTNKLGQNSFIPFSPFVDGFVYGRAIGEDVPRGDPYNAQVIFPNFLIYFSSINDPNYHPLRIVNQGSKMDLTKENQEMNRKWNFAGFKPTWWASVLMIVMLGLAACQQTAAPTQSVPVTAPTNVPAVMPSATTAAPAAAEPVINVATDAKLGKILVDSKGMTLYIFTKDTADKSNCAGGCLKAWPPLATSGSAKAGDGVDQSMIGTTTGTDGKTKIVTYNHMPLYYFASDVKAGDTAGQKVGGVWFVIGPDGKPIGMDSASAASSSGSQAGAVTVNVATDAKLGKFLVDGKGMSLYMYTKDEPDKSNCSGGCLKAWPPLVSAGDVKAGDGVDQSMIGSATLADGSKIVTYNHMPLYYYAKDTKAGDVTGQDVGSVWYVVTPDGKKDDPGEAESSGSSAAASGVTLNVASNATLGKILVDGQGKTLYMFTKDTPDKSNCAAGCLKAWPPLVAAGDVKAGDGIDKSMIGSAALADGSKVVTYNHMPLYYFANDAKAGDTAGQGVGSVWFVVSPDGKPVGESGTGY
jgi:predicted lipoprotein with Yx(FWY)xxD motif